MHRADTCTITLYKHERVALTLHESEGGREDKEKTSEKTSGGLMGQRVQVSTGGIEEAVAARDQAFRILYAVSGATNTETSASITNFKRAAGWRDTRGACSGK